MKPTDATRATAQAMPEINRRRFLTGAAMAGAVVAVAAPVAAAEPVRPVLEPLVYADDYVSMMDRARPKPSRRERAIWHMRELERLLFADGADTASVLVIGTYKAPDACKLLGIYPGGRLRDGDGLFAPKGGAA